MKVRFTTVLTTAAAAAVAAAFAASLAQADVLIASGGFGGQDALDDVREKIQSTGILAGHTIDTIDLSTDTPTAQELAAYDAVLSFTDSDPVDPTLWGDRLADYVDSGGGVAVMTFTWNVGKAGRFFTDGYSPLLSDSQTQNVQMGIGTVHCPNHAILWSVNSFDGGTASYHNTGSYAPGAIAIADWEDDLPFAAEMPGFNARIIAVNFYPPSNDERNDFWDATTDGGVLMANALWYAMTAPGPIPSMPRSFKIKKGDKTGGNKMSLAESDNDRLEVEAEQTGNKHRTNTIITLNVACPDITSLSLIVETGVDASNVKTRIHLYDFANGRWRKIVGFGQDRHDRSMQFAVNNPARFVNNASKMKVRITSKRKGDDDYTLRHDHVEALIEPVTQ